MIVLLPVSVYPLYILLGGLFDRLAVCASIYLPYFFVFYAVRVVSKTIIR
jgi:hypothetical protein